MFLLLSSRWSLVLLHSACEYVAKKIASCCGMGKNNDELTKGGVSGEGGQGYNETTEDRKRREQKEYQTVSSYETYGG